MTKERYLEELSQELDKRRVKDRIDILSYFEEMITDREENGEDIEDILKRLGEPDELAESFEKEKGNTVYLSDYLEDIEEKTVENNAEYFKDVTQLEIEVTGYDVTITESEDDGLTVQYSSDSQSSLNIRQHNHTLEIEQHDDYPHMFRRFFKDETEIGKLSLTICLPKGGIQSLEAESVAGSLSLFDCHIRKIEAENVTGSLKAENVVCERAELESVSGRIEAMNFTGERWVSFESVNGSLALERIRSDRIKAETVTGNIDMSVADSEDEYTVRIEALSRTERYKGSGSKKLEIETLSGKIAYTFMN